MPNAAPPLHRAARDRAAEVTSPSVSRTGASPAASAVAPPSTSSPDGALTGVPASWAGFGALLAGAGERAPADALRLASVTTDMAGTADRVDLSGMWALHADPAAPRSHELIRTLDDRGRLMLPITVPQATRVPTERDGALVTVFLPGSTDRPRPGFAAAALPLDARGRLTLSAGVRRQAGIPDCADVFAVLDPDRGTVTLTAASRLSAGITGLLDGLRRPDRRPDRRGRRRNRRAGGRRHRGRACPRRHGHRTRRHRTRRRPRRRRATAHRPLTRTVPRVPPRPGTTGAAAPKRRAINDHQTCRRHAGDERRRPRGDAHRPAGPGLRPR
jgi:hypothetical protein